MQAETIRRIHAGHLGLQKCLLCAKTSVWWPGMSGQLKKQIQICRECKEHAIQGRKSTPLPTHPWEVVGADLFQLKGVNFL